MGLENQELINLKHNFIILKRNEAKEKIRSAFLWWFGAPNAFLTNLGHKNCIGAEAVSMMIGRRLARDKSVTITQRPQIFFSLPWPPVAREYSWGCATSSTALISNAIIIGNFYFIFLVLVFFQHSLISTRNVRFPEMNFVMIEFQCKFSIYFKIKKKTLRSAAKKKFKFFEWKFLF